MIFGGMDSVSPNLRRPGTSQHSPTLHMAGKLKARRATYLVFTIFKKALIELSRVTICARPVQLSVTVMTGQENTRNSSNEEKRWPHVRSYHGTAWCWKNPIHAEYTCPICDSQSTHHIYALQHLNRFDAQIGDHTPSPWVLRQ